MLRKDQSNGYIGKAELSKNRKKNYLFSIFFVKISTWSPVECIFAGLHVEFFQKILNKKVLLFFLWWPIFGDEIHFSTSKTKNEYKIPMKANFFHCPTLFMVYK